MFISWEGKDDELYTRARMIHGSYYRSGVVFVDPSHYKEIEDFAQVYGFKFSPGAIKSIEEFKDSIKKVEVVNPVETKETETRDVLGDILKASSDILVDLKEDD